jgi:hypothetical protein
MLDHCSILTTGGLTLWTRSYTSSPSPFDSFVRNALVDELDAADDRWDGEGYTVRWAKSVEDGLIFVVSLRVFPFNSSSHSASKGRPSPDPPDRLYSRSARRHEDALPLHVRACSKGHR